MFSRASLARAAVGALIAAFLIAAADSTLEKYFLARDAPPQARKAPFTGTREFSGEALIHGALFRDRLVAGHLPLGSVIHARILNHSEPRRTRAWLFIFLLANITLVFILGCLSGSMVVGALAVVLYALGRHAVSDISGATQMIYSVFVLTTAALLVWRARKPTPLRSALLGAGIGLSLLYRSPLVFFPPLLTAYELFVRRGSLSGPRWKHALGLGALPYAFLLPWIFMNAVVFGRFIPFEYQEADINIVSGALGIVGGIDGDLRALVPDLPDENQSGVIVAWAVREVFRHPLRYAVSCARRAAYVAGWHPFLILFALAGALYWRRKPEIAGLSLLAAYFFGIHCLMGVMPNYFTPFWPILAVLAASLAGLLLKRDRLGLDIPARQAATVILGLIFAGTAAAGAYTVVVLTRYAAGAAEFSAVADREIKRHPSDAWLHRERGLIRLERFDRLGAVSDFEAALDRDPGDDLSRLRLAWARLLSGDTASILWLEPMPHVDPEILKVLAYIHLGWHDAARNQWNKAKSDWESAAHVWKQDTASDWDTLRRLRAAQDSVFAHYAASIADDYRNTQEALEVLGKLADLFPREPDLWIAHGAAALRAGLPPLARSSLRRAQSLLTAASPEGTAGRLRSTWNSLEEKSSPSRERPSDENAGAVRAGDCVRARKRFAEYSARKVERSGEAAILKDIGICEFMDGNPEKAIDYLREAVEQDPGLLSAYLSWGHVLESRKRIAEARRVYETGLNVQSVTEPGLRPLLEQRLGELR